MLIVESLDWPGNVIIRANTFLHVFSVVNVALLDIVVLLFVTGRRQVESEDCLCLLEL